MNQEYTFLITDLDQILRTNFDRISRNRFVIDSPRFWRPEFHPRFKDIFDYQEIRNIIELSLVNISFPFRSGFIDSLSIKIFEYFSGYRFADIPAKNPQATQQFLSELYFVLMDIMPSISFTDYPLIDDDFNLVTNRAETDKNDTSKLATGEHNRQGSGLETRLDILSDSTMSQINNSNTENIDEESLQNTKTINDTFLSPQNAGVTPTTTNPEFSGVNGIPLPNEAAFTTTTNKQNLGDSTKNQSNTFSQGQQSTNVLQQNNDSRTAHKTDNDFGMTQEQESTFAKHDGYVESLDFNRGARLQDFYNLVDNRLWKEILSRLSRWILQADIATSDRNYNECPVFE